MAVVGPSVPARRPFFRPQSEVPSLIMEASQFAARRIFVYSLAGGWPSGNSAARLIASLLAVSCAFSFALIASLTSQRLSRITFCALLSLTALVALIAAIMDTASLVKTAKECGDEACVTAVPQEVLDSGNTCKCAVDGWFYGTLIADVVLLSTAVICLILTVARMRERRGVDPSY